jgi:hypothetical protein
VQVQKGFAPPFHPDPSLTLGMTLLSACYRLLVAWRNERAAALLRRKLRSVPCMMESVDRRARP